MMMSKNLTFNGTTTQGHSCYFYTDAEDRFEVLAQYFKQGLDNNELCIFVTAEPLEDTILHFMNFGLDISKAVKDKSLRIFEMNSTYISNGRFVTEYMLNNVSSFIDNAKQEGYSGLRTAGEMNWTKEHPEAVDDAIDYEDKVNSLCTADSNFIGLCLYAMQENYGPIIRGAARTHPTYIYDRQIKTNPYFVPA